MKLRLLAPLCALVPAMHAAAAPLAPGDLLMSCSYWGVTRIEPATGEQHPLGVGSGGAYATLAEDADGLVWTIDNRWVVSIDPATGEHRAVVQLPNDFNGSNDGELLPEPGGTLLYAGDGAVSRIDPETGSVTPVVTGAPLVNPRGLEWAQNGDLLIVDYGAGAVLRWNEANGIATIASGDLLVAPTRVRQLADGDLLVLRAATGIGGRPVRVHPADGAQSLYSTTIGSVSSAAVASNGDLIYANTTSATGALYRLTSPTAQPILLLDPGASERLYNVAYLALTSDDRVLLAGTLQEWTNGVVTDSSGSFSIFDPATGAFDVLSRRPPPGGIATSADGRIFLANQAGAGFNLRELDPRTGDTRRVAAGTLFSRPFDAAVEPDGRVVVVNGIPNGTPSVLRVDPETGDTSLLSPTQQLIDPEKIVVAPGGAIYVSDFQVGIVRIDPVTGAQAPVPDSDTLVFLDDLEAEAGGTLIVAEQAGEHLSRVAPVSGVRNEVGPLLDEPGVQDEPQGYGTPSALGLGLDGTPYVTLLASSAPNGYALFRAPTDSAVIERVSELPLCRGDDLELVKSLPVPEPGGVLAGAAAFAWLARRYRRSAM